MVTLRYRKLTDCTYLGCIFIAGCLTWVFAFRFVQGSLTSGPSSFAKWATEQNRFATKTELCKLLKLVNCLQYYSTLGSNYQTTPPFGRLDYGFIPSRFGDLYFTNWRGQNICVVVFITLVLVGPWGFRDMYFYIYIVPYIRSDPLNEWMNKNRLLCCRYVSHMSDLFEVEQLDKTDLPVTSRLGPLMQTMIGNLNLVLVMVPCLGEQVLNLYKQTCTTPKTWHLVIKTYQTSRHVQLSEKLFGRILSGWCFMSVCKAAFKS